MPYRTAVAFALVAVWAGVAHAQRVPGFTPSPLIELKGVRRTSAEHDAIYSKRPFPYVLDLKVGKGRLVFFGMTHSNDPADPQFAQLATKWSEVRPTVALVEGRPTLYQGKLEDAAKRGEPSFVMALAKRDGCTLYTLEPPAEVQGAALAKLEHPDRVLLLLVLNGFVTDRRIDGRAPSDVMVNFSIRRRAKEYGLASTMTTTKDLDALWKKDFPDSPNWREIEDRALWPSPGGTYLNALARASNVVRDEHWAWVMIELVRSGETVLAVGGASHAIVLEPVLRATLKAGKTASGEGPALIRR